MVQACEWAENRKAVRHCHQRPRASPRQMYRQVERPCVEDRHGKHAARDTHMRLTASVRGISLWPTTLASCGETRRTALRPDMLACLAARFVLLVVWGGWWWGYVRVVGPRGARGLNGNVWQPGRHVVWGGVVWCGVVCMRTQRSVAVGSKRQPRTDSCPRFFSHPLCHVIKANRAMEVDWPLLTL